MQVLAKSLEAQVLQSDNSALAKDCRKEVKAINGRLLKLGRRDYAERRALRSELKLLLKEERKRQEKAVEGVISGSQACIPCPVGLASTSQLSSLVRAGVLSVFWQRPPLAQTTPEELHVHAYASVITSALHREMEVLVNVGLTS